MSKENFHFIGETAAGSYTPFLPLSTASTSSAGAPAAAQPQLGSTGRAAGPARP